MAVAGYDIRVDHGSWMDAGNVLSKFLRGMNPQDYALELRARDAANNVSEVAGPIFGRPTAEPPGGTATKANLVGYWPLDEASGNAIDAHGSNDLTDTNTVGAGTGVVSGARDFDEANSEYFTIADNADLSMGDIDFTISCWVNLDNWRNHVFVGKASNPYSTADVEYCLLYNQATSQFDFVVSDGATKTSASVSMFVFGSWIHLCAWHDSVNNTVNLSVNNGTPASAAHSAGVSNGTYPFRIGHADQVWSYTNGLIDEVAVWKRLLTADERTWLYNEGNGRSYAEFTDTNSLKIDTPCGVDGTVGTSFSQTLAASYNVGSITWAVSMGVLPPGLSLAPSTGVISGTPTTAGYYTFIISATDGSSTGYKFLSIVVDAPISSYLLDDISATPATTTPLRKIRSAYAGQCIRVRRSEDNTETDIGFTANGNLDKAACIAFSTRELEVVKVYDQSTNANDWILYNATDVPTLNYDRFQGRPALDHGPLGTHRALVTEDSISPTQLQAYMALDVLDTTQQQMIFEVDLNQFMAKVNNGVFELYNGAEVNVGRYDAGRRQVSVNFKTGTDRCFVDGVERPVTTGDFGGTNAGDTSGSGPILLGKRSDTAGGNLGLEGYVAEAIFFLDDTVSDDDRATIHASQAAYFTPDAPPSPLSYQNILMLEGDSRTRGYNSIAIDNAPLLTPMVAELDDTWFVRSVARSGETLLGHYLVQADAQVNEFYNPDLVHNIVFVWGMVNDMAGDPGELLDENDLYAGLTALVASYQAAGFTVGVGTELPTDSPTFVTANQNNVIRPAYNALVIANSAGADFVVDFSDDPDLDDATDETYFDPDGTHLQQAAVAKQAVLIKAAIDAL